MVEMTATIDGAACNAFDAAFQEFAKSLGTGAASAPRRAAISVCKNFRAATRIAPHYARSSEYTAVKSDKSHRFKYITGKDGRKLRRWTLDRPPRGKTYDVYAADKHELRIKRLVLAHRGLAKKSWGWVMHNIFNGAAPDTPWQLRKYDRRNPKDSTIDSFSREHKSITNPSGIARICNRIDYIADTLKISVDAILSKAANKLIRPIINARLKAGGMSPEEIRSAGHDIHSEWLSQFRD